MSAIRWILSIKLYKTKPKQGGDDFAARFFISDCIFLISAVLHCLKFNCNSNSAIMQEIPIFCWYYTTHRRINRAFSHFMSEKSQARTHFMSEKTEVRTHFMSERLRSFHNLWLSYRPGCAFFDNSGRVFYIFRLPGARIFCFLSPAGERVRRQCPTTP